MNRDPIKVCLAYPIEAYAIDLIREAYLVIDVDGIVIKNRVGYEGVEASDEQIAECVEVDAEQAENLLAEYREAEA